MAEEEFNRIFVDKGLPDDIPDFEVTAEDQIGLAQLMVKVGVAPSNGEAGRLIQCGGVQIDGEKVSDPR